MGGFGSWICELRFIGALVAGIWCLEVGAYRLKTDREQNASDRNRARALDSQEVRLGGFGDQFGAKASRADLHSNHPSLFGRLHLMEVGIPNLLGLIIGVAHIVAKDRSFSTNITHSCHG